MCVGTKEFLCTVGIRAFCCYEGMLLGTDNRTCQVNDDEFEIYGFGFKDTFKGTMKHIRCVIHPNSMTPHYPVIIPRLPRCPGTLKQLRRLLRRYGAHVLVRG